jgi:superfamily II DNA/RNA helicase
MFSATMAPEIRALTTEFLRDPVVVIVGAQKPASGIVQSVYPVAQDRKTRLLTTLLRREGMRSVLVFVKRKSEADQLARAVTRSGVRATSIHSDRAQEDRIRALESFRRGESPVLVATDVAARYRRRGHPHVLLRRPGLIRRLHPPRWSHRGPVRWAGDHLRVPAEERLCAIEKAIGRPATRRAANFDPGVHVHVPPGRSGRGGRTAPAPAASGLGARCRRRRS